MPLDEENLGKPTFLKLDCCRPFLECHDDSLINQLIKNDSIKGSCKNFLNFFLILARRYYHTTGPDESTGKKILKKLNREH